jgi:hypothetical protein
MSLKAGGGNLGTIFSTLTYSDMIAMVGWRAWGCEGCCGGSIVDEKTAQTCFRSGLRNRANGPLRNRTGCSLTKQPTTCILLPCIHRILTSFVVLVDWCYGFSCDSAHLHGILPKCSRSVSPVTFHSLSLSEVFLRTWVSWVGLPCTPLVPTYSPTHSRMLAVSIQSHMVSLYGRPVIACYDPSPDLGCWSSSTLDGKGRIADHALTCSTRMCAWHKLETCEVHEQVTSSRSLERTNHLSTSSI